MRASHFSADMPPEEIGLRGEPLRSLLVEGKQCWEVPVLDCGKGSSNVGSSFWMPMAISSKMKHLASERSDFLGPF